MIWGRSADPEAYPNLQNLKSGYDWGSVQGFLQAPKHTRISKSKLWIRFGPGSGIPAGPEAYPDLKI